MFLIILMLGVLLGLFQAITNLCKEFIPFQHLLLYCWQPRFTGS